MVKKKTAFCDCIEQVQEQLAESNARLLIESLIRTKTGEIRSSPPSLRLEKIDSSKRKRLPTLFCSHCPFCGKKYPKT